MSLCELSQRDVVPPDKSLFPFLLLSLFPSNCFSGSHSWFFVGLFVFMIQMDGIDGFSWMIISIKLQYIHESKLG